jgi:ketosteroid isomerase-like protein
MVRETVERLSARLYARDAMIAGEFEDDAVLIGSEAGERADGRDAIARLFAKLMNKPRTVRWVWDRLDIVIEGDVAWILGVGNAMLGQDGAERAFPYRLSGVLLCRDGVWRWKLFHGSEPSA